MNRARASRWHQSQIVFKPLYANNNGQFELESCPQALFARAALEISPPGGEEFLYYQTEKMGRCKSLISTYKLILRYKGQIFFSDGGMHHTRFCLLCLFYPSDNLARGVLLLAFCLSVLPSAFESCHNVCVISPQVSAGSSRDIPKGV